MQTTPTPLIKICGLKDPAHIQLLGELNVDYAGFVFVAGSPRKVSFAQAHALTHAARQANVKTVGLFCNAPRPAVSLAAQALQLDVVQLHGQENADYLHTLTLPQTTQVWKAIPFTPANVDTYRGSKLDALLLDAPPKDGLTGGTGHAFDWAALADLDPADLPPLIPSLPTTTAPPLTPTPLQPPTDTNTNTTNIHPSILHHYRPKPQPSHRNEPVFSFG